MLQRGKGSIVKLQYTRKTLAEDGVWNWTTETFAHPLSRYSGFPRKVWLWQWQGSGRHKRKLSVPLSCMSPHCLTRCWTSATRGLMRKQWGSWWDTRTLTRSGVWNKYHSSSSSLLFYSFLLKKKTKLYHLTITPQIRISCLMVPGVASSLGLPIFPPPFHTFSFFAYYHLLHPLLRPSCPHPPLYLHSSYPSSTLHSLTSHLPLPT